VVFQTPPTRWGGADSANTSGANFTQTSGASYRQIIDLADWDRSNGRVYRIQALDPKIHAIVTVTADSALQRAREADAALARGTVWGPLHGVPCTIFEASWYLRGLEQFLLDFHEDRDLSRSFSIRPWPIIWRSRASSWKWAWMAAGPANPVALSQPLRRYVAPGFTGISREFQPSQSPLAFSRTVNSSARFQTALRG
jgi:hypothetical protein